jgi:hypothetical protein
LSSCHVLDGFVVRVRFYAEIGVLDSSLLGRVQFLHIVLVVVVIVLLEANVHSDVLVDAALVDARVWTLVYALVSQLQMHVVPVRSVFHVGGQTGPPGLTVSSGAVVELVCEGWLGNHFFFESVDNVFLEMHDVGGGFDQEVEIFLQYADGDPDSRFGVH